MDNLASLNEEIIACRKCPRLVAWREEVAIKKREAFREETYWGKPAPGFGDPEARILVVGLAPGAHGANRTGRVFTGDSSGQFLFRAMHKAGFANQPTSTHNGDGLRLIDTYIAAVCRCVPPDNKPAQAEIDACLPFMAAELDLLKNLQGIVALGKIGFDNFLRLYKNKYGAVFVQSEYKFAHGACYRLEGPKPLWLLATYHPSQQNTQTGRLTEAMFDEIWTKARQLLED